MKRALERRDTRSLRVLVACRTADYQSELTGVLKQALGGCAVADLAPLTRADVATLAEGEGVDGEAFVEAVAATGVGLLASIPLTLQILLPVYKENPVFLNEDSLKLFGRGVLRLADEPDRGRASIGSAVNSPEQRVVIASRIAARVVLAGQRTIRTGDVASAGPDDVTSGILAGGSEELTDPFAVTNAAVDGTLRTALFSRTGPDHVAFAHSSFAAFLSARYLATRMRGRAIEARRQLAGVFLVAAPDEDTASIPVYLRETAAWLLAHAPGDYHWLAQADPQGLMAHSAHITDPAVRRLIVDGLLRRAEEVEFSTPPWQRTRWRIDHPGMGAQLHAVLDGATATSSSVWPQFAKTRLALHLARHCSDTSLVEPLLTVAENPDQQTDLRQIAAQSAMHVSPDRAVPRLRILLASLVDEHTDDPTERDELIGVLLSLLWPQYLLLSEVLVHVHPVADPLFFGDYRMQITRLPDQVPDSGLDELVRFARDVAADALHVADGEPLLGRDNVEVAGRMVAASRSRSERAVRDVVVPILDRVTTCETPGEHLPVVVELLVGLRQVSARLPLPAGLAWVDPRGEEPVVVRDLRRQVTEDFTRNLLAHVEHFTRAHAYLITGRWKVGQRSGTPKTAYLAGGIGERTQLIDSHDVAWLLERAARHRADGDDDLGEALVIIASDVADLSDPAILELVYELHGTPDWQHFPWLQDAQGDCVVRHQGAELGVCEVKGLRGGDGGG